MENLKTQDANSASVIRNSSSAEALSAVGVYHVECIGPDGQLKWADDALNLVVNQGKNGMLDTYLAGSAYTAVWYMSLITGGTAVSTSTYASPTVTEIAAGIITGNTRLTVAWSAAATGSKSATTTSFAITGSATITGNMLVTGGTGANTVLNTAATGGILFSSANFSAGSKTVSNGDTLNVTYSLSV
jgi:hypothetical protein